MIITALWSLYFKTLNYVATLCNVIKATAYKIALKEYF